MKLFLGAGIGALLVPAAAFAQAAPAGTPAPAAGAQVQAGAQATTPTVGATVYDSTGAVLGTVEQVTPQAVVVNIGGNKVGLPPAAVGAGPQGLRVATTRADIEAKAREAQAGQAQQVASQLTTGATVRGAAGASVGTVKSADAQFVTLTTPRGDVKLPTTAFAVGANGPTISMTAAQLDAAITQAGGASQPAAATDAATSTPSAGAQATAGAAAAGTAAAATRATATRTRTRTTTTRRTQRNRR